MLLIIRAVQEGEKERGKRSELGEQSRQRIGAPEVSELPLDAIKAAKKRMAGTQDTFVEGIRRYIQ